jgi:hypothetical protein
MVLFGVVLEGPEGIDPLMTGREGPGFGNSTNFSALTGEALGSVGLVFFAAGFSSSEDESEDEEEDEDDEGEDVCAFLMAALTSIFAFFDSWSDASLGLRFNGEAVAATEDGGAAF